MDATTRAPDASSAGSSSSAQAATPGFWRPTLLSIPPGTGCSRGAGLPDHGSAESDFTTTAPRSREGDIGTELGAMTRRT